jgi:predicted AlkP superfamily phosphohydrolase/phosphomutase
MAGVFALCLLACPSTPQPAREQWLSLRETGYPIECDGKPAVWKLRPGPNIDVYGLRQAPGVKCRFEVQVPDRSTLGFRASLAAKGRQPAKGAVSVRITARRVDAAADPAQVVFEEELNASRSFTHFEAALPAGLLEIELSSQRTGRGRRKPSVDWSRLVIRTSDPDFSGAAPWAIDARQALAPYYSERLPPPRTPGRRRMLIIGIDGASWDLLTPMIEAGELPALASLKQRGRWGQLDSTVIPESAMAWTAIGTGVGAGKSGVYRFFSRGRGRRAFWHMLGDQGLRSLIVAVPKAFANQPLHGVIIGGWTYKTESSFVYPTDLKPHVLRAGYQPELRNLRNVDDYREHMSRRTDLSLALMAFEDWDLTFLVYEYTDTVGHRFGLATPEWAEVYRAADAELARVLSAAGEGVAVLVVSDHGWKTYPRSFHMAPWLQSKGHHGYVHDLSSGSVISVSEGEHADGSAPMTHDELDRALTEIQRDLEEIRIPGSGQRLVQQVRDLPTAFPGPVSLELPNQLIVDVREDFRLFPAGELGFSSRPVDHHSPSGIYLLAAPGIEPGHGPRQSVTDVAATVLQFFGVASQADADGTPMDEFGRSALAKAGPAFFDDPDAGGVQETDPKTDKQLTEQLRALGYIE